MSQALRYLLRFLAFNSDDAPLMAPQSQQGRSASVCHKMVTDCDRMVTGAPLRHGGKLLSQPVTTTITTVRHDGLSRRVARQIWGGKLAVDGRTRGGSPDRRRAHLIPEDCLCNRRGHQRDRLLEAPRIRDEAPRGRASALDAGIVPVQPDPPPSSRSISRIIGHQLEFAPTALPIGPPLGSLRWRSRRHRHPPRPAPLQRWRLVAPDIDGAVAIHPVHAAVDGLGLTDVRRPNAS